MADEPLDYPRWIAEALVDVARRALRSVAEQGLPGEHHFFVTFRTDAPGVFIPQSLRNRFPTEMTIVLQHQFWGLDVSDEAFSVSLRFSGAVQQLTVPFGALTAFVDPSVGLGLQFRVGAKTDGAAPSTEAPEAKADGPPPSAPSGNDRSENVIAFDAFRKK
jgi:hypothetical protein